MRSIPARVLTGYFSVLGDVCKALYPIDKAMTKLNLMHWMSYF